MFDIAYMHCGKCKTIYPRIGWRDAPWCNDCGTVMIKWKENKEVEQQYDTVYFGYHAVVHALGDDKAKTLCGMEVISKHNRSDRPVTCASCRREIAERATLEINHE